MNIETIAAQVLEIFRTHGAKPIRIMDMRKRIDGQPREHFIRNAIYSLEAQGLIARAKGPQNMGVCYKIIDKENN